MLRKRYTCAGFECGAGTMFGDSATRGSRTRANVAASTPAHGIAATPRKRGDAGNVDDVGDVDDATPDEAMRAVEGYAVALDLTLRDEQAVAKKAGKPWSAAKGFRGSAPIGRFVSAAELGDVAGRAVRLSVNDAERQSGNTDQMMWPVGELLAQLSRQIPLSSGDVVLTGTPAGVGPIEPGDRVVAAIDGLPPLELEMT